MIKKLTLYIVLTMMVFGVGQAFAEEVKGTAEKPFVEITSYHKDTDVSKVGINDNLWSGVASYRQPLEKQYLVVPKPVEVGVKELVVQSINDGKYIAFRLVWKDATENSSIKVTGFSDAAAIEFPVKTDPLPQYIMGQTDMPVHILYWRAWRSKDTKDGFQTIDTAYPNLTSDMYTFDYKVKGKGTEKTQEEKDMFIPGKAAVNPRSVPHKQIIEELNAEGPGTLKTKNVENTTGESHWSDGTWTLVIRRPLKVDDAVSAQLVVGKKTPIAFAVWEGERKESAGRKAVSPSWAEVLVQ
ncbi:MAG: hypothetical protein HQK92_02700 [Nitrospirae bacterium]|nr:hypothetical protein [Nitrospirota bacterium]